MYLGHSPTNAGSFVFLDDMDGLGYDGSSAYDQDFDGSITAFKMQVGGVDVTPKSASLLIAIDGVVQQSPSAYTVSASVLTFTGAPASTQEFYGILMGQSASVGAGTVDEATLKISNAGSNGQYLQKQSANTGGLTWAAVDTFDGFVLEDGDGTEVSITENKEIKFVEGTGIDINWTDTSDGSDSDPYDLTITCDLDASELAGNTLASGVTVSSLTSVGTLTTLTVDNVITNGTNIGHTSDTDLMALASGVLTVAGNILPEANGTRDLGADGTRWANIYTSDLHLTNERGSWTVIEEEDYLTLRNNKNDKVYKLVMEEIE